MSFASKYFAKNQGQKSPTTWRSIELLLVSIKGRELQRTTQNRADAASLLKGCSCPQYESCLGQCLSFLKSIQQILDYGTLEYGIFLPQIWILIPRKNSILKYSKNMVLFLQKYHMFFIFLLHVFAFDFSSSILVFNETALNITD